MTDKIKSIVHDTVGRTVEYVQYKIQDDIL